MEEKKYRNEKVLPYKFYVDFHTFLFFKAKKKTKKYGTKKFNSIYFIGISIHSFVEIPCF